MLDARSKNTSIDLYKKEDKEAIDKYSKFEQKYRDQKNYSTVLVSVNDIKNLRKNYPNYFGDVTEFIKELKKILEKE